MTDARKYTNKLFKARILIFGGSSGIGFGVAEASLEHGATVIISSSSNSRIASTISALQQCYPSYKNNISGYVCDLGDLANLEANIERLFDQVGPLDHIIFTAGDKLAAMPIEDVTVEAITSAGTLRFYAPLLVAKHAAKLLSAGPGSSITLTTGSVAERPIPGWSVVNGFATGLIGLTRGLALDLAPIRVNAISPGAVITPLWNSFAEEERKVLFESFRAGTTTGAVAQIEDVAEAYLYAMKDKNLTGSVINTNGGGLLK